MKGNTPEFILEHFIAFSFDGTSMTPSRKSLNLTVMAIQHFHSQSCSKLSKNPTMDYNDQFTVITSSTVVVTLTLLQVHKFTANKC